MRVQAFSDGDGDGDGDGDEDGDGDGVGDIVSKEKNSQKPLVNFLFQNGSKDTEVKDSFVQELFNGEKRFD